MTTDTYNNQPVQSPQSGGVWKGIFLGTSLPFLLVIILFLFEVFAPKESSLIAHTIERLGYSQGLGEAERLKMVAEHQAKMEELMQLAVAEVERGNQAYGSYYQAMQQVIPLAYQMEDKVLAAQIDAIRASYAGKTTGTSIADFIGMLGTAMGDPYMASLSNQGDNTREDMVRQIKELTENHRSQIPINIINNLPKPEVLDLRALEFKRLAEVIKNG